MSKELFRQELEVLINKTGMDSATNIPDWILANMLEKYVEALIYLDTYVYLNKQRQLDEELSNG